MTDTPIIDEEINYCTVHTEREASLRCIRCDRYMCTQCIVHSPVGYICKQCARQHDDRFFNATNSDGIVVFITTAVLTGIGGALVSVINIPILFFLIFGLPIGGLVAEAALRLTKRRRGRYSQWFAVAGTLIGGIAGLAAYAAYYYSTLSNRELVVQALILDMDVSRSSDVSMLDFVIAWVPYQGTALIFIAIIAFAVYGRYRVRI